MSEALVYLNGRMIPAAEAHLAIYDAGVVLGATVSELTRTFRRKFFRLETHLERLLDSLRIARIKIELSTAELVALSDTLLAQNSPCVDAEDELGIVHFVTAGEYPTYASMTGRPARLDPTVCIHTFPLPFELWAQRLRLGVRLITPSIRHVPPQCYDPRMKYRSRLHFYMADKEAQAADPEALALLLDLAGNLTETATGNFLMIDRGTLVSPTLTNIFPGISRATAIDIAGTIGLPFVERDIQPSEATQASEAFIASTPYCLMPVASLNGVPIGTGKPGPIYRQLLDQWGRLVGVDIEKQILEGAERRLREKSPPA